MGIIKRISRPMGLATMGLWNEEILNAAPKKEWIPIALAAASLVTSVAGGIASRNRARRGRRAVNESKREEEAWYNRRYNEDYADTKAGQNLIRKAKDYARQQVKRAEGHAAVAGATDAQVQMAKDSTNKMVGDTIANIGAADQERKARVDDMHRKSQMGFAQEEAAYHAQQAQNIASTAQAASNAMASMAGSMGGGTRAGDKNLMGADNNSVVAVNGSGEPIYNYEKGWDIPV